jgi:hypothetical protein
MMANDQPFFLHHTDDDVYDTSNQSKSSSNGLMHVVLAGTASEPQALLHDYESLSDDDDSIVGPDKSAEKEREATTKDSFLQLLADAKDGSDFLKLIDMLPNSANRYGHSLTMNAIIKILCRHKHIRNHVKYL